MFKKLLGMAKNATQKFNEYVGKKLNPLDVEETTIMQETAELNQRAATLESEIVDSLGSNFSPDVEQKEIIEIEEFLQKAEKTLNDFNKVNADISKILSDEYEEVQSMIEELSNLLGEYKQSMTDYLENLSLRLKAANFGLFRQISSMVSNIAVNFEKFQENIDNLSRSNQDLASKFINKNSFDDVLNGNSDAISNDLSTLHSFLEQRGNHTEQIRNNVAELEASFSDILQKIKSNNITDDDFVKLFEMGKKLSSAIQPFQERIGISNAIISYAYMFDARNAQVALNIIKDSGTILGLVQKLEKKDKELVQQNVDSNLKNRITEMLGRLHQDEEKVSRTISLADKYRKQTLDLLKYQRLKPYKSGGKIAGKVGLGIATMGVSAVIMNGQSISKKMDDAYLGIKYAVKKIEQESKEGSLGKVLAKYANDFANGIAYFFYMLSTTIYGKLKQGFDYIINLIQKVIKLPDFSSNSLSEIKNKFDIWKRANSQKFVEFSNTVLPAIIVVFMTTISIVKISALVV